MDRQVKGEIDTIVARLKEHFQSEKNRDDESLIQFSYDKAKLSHDHIILKEIVSFGNKGKQLTLPAVNNLDLSFGKLTRGMSLEIPELLAFKNLIFACEDMIDRFGKEASMPVVRDLVLDLFDMPDIVRLMDVSFGPDGEVLDSASSKLMSVRKELRSLLSEESKLVQKISAKYKSYLEISQPVLKNGIQTLAVTAGKKASVPGMILDRSKSGETLFVVPYELLEFENRKEKLIDEEKAEIARILESFSKMLTQRLTELDKDYYLYNLLDQYIGKVEYGFTYDGVVAELSDDSLSLHGLIHPLLSLDKAIDNDVELGGGTPKILLISGPNAGGKSVLMKAIALAAIMNQMGLLVASHNGAALKVFDEVDILTGDAESLSGNLSSFSGHLLGLKNMYEKASGNSLVLVDEIGQGTSPEDGEAIGYSFIEHILKIGAFGVFTTHFEGLKKYALSKDGILSGAMEFSEKDLAPSFKYLPGAIGNSYAFEVAKKNGLPDELLKSALEYRDSQRKFDVVKLTEELNLKIKQNDALQKKLDDRLNSAKALEEKRLSAIKSLNEERENIRKKADKKVDEYARQRLEQLDNLWNQGSKQGLAFNEKSQIKGEIRKIASVEQPDNEFRKKVKTADELKPGDVVSYGNMVGKIVSLNKTKAKFYFNGMTMTVNIQDLVKTTANHLPPVRSVSALDDAIMHRASGVSTRLNVIGLTVDEALPEVDKFLDNAVLSHLSSVIIIHGMGTFALRNGIWAHLKNIKYVKSFREGGEGEGGLGATVVVLK